MALKNMMTPKAREIECNAAFGAIVDRMVDVLRDPTESGFSALREAVFDAIGNTDAAEVELFAEELTKVTSPRS